METTFPIIRTDVYMYRFWFSVTKQRKVFTEYGYYWDITEIIEGNHEGEELLLCKDLSDFTKYIRWVYKNCFDYSMGPIEIKALNDLTKTMDNSIAFQKPIDSKGDEILKLKIWINNTLDYSIEHPFKIEGFPEELGYFNLWLFTIEQIEPNLIRVFSKFTSQIFEKTKNIEDVSIFETIEEKIGFRLKEDEFQSKQSLKETIVRMSIDHSKNEKAICLLIDDFEDTIKEKYKYIDIWIYNRPLHFPRAWYPWNAEFLIQQIWEDELEQYEWKSADDPELPEFNLKKEYKNYYDQILDANKKLQEFRETKPKFERFLTTEKSKILPTELNYEIKKILFGVNSKLNTF